MRFSDILNSTATVKDGETVRPTSLEVEPVSIRGEGALRGPRLSLLIKRAEAQEPERVKQ